MRQFLLLTVFLLVVHFLIFSQHNNREQVLTSSAIPTIKSLPADLAIDTICFLKKINDSIFSNYLTSVCPKTYNHHSIMLINS
jgi:hypothetical protein